MTNAQYVVAYHNNDKVCEMVTLAYMFWLLIDLCRTASSFSLTCCALSPDGTAKTRSVSLVP